MSVGKTFIELKGIVKLFPGVRALGGVSFDIREGEVHSLCGENGAGKSTLIKVMTGAHQRDEGQYLIDGKEVQFKSTQEAIAMGVSCVYQELSIAPQLDVAHNLFIGNLPVKGGLVDHRTLYAETERILAELDMPIPAKTIAGDLSVGQQQMIEIGRALTRNARLIIMDEPTSSLSEAETETLFQIIRKLVAKNIAIVYISHKLDEVMYLSDRITVIRDGENIVTTDKEATNQEQLIANMIGRELSNLYRKEPAEAGDVVLDVKNLTRTGVFEDISFQVRSGEVVGFFGLVGAGRSEIMRAVFGVDKYQSGSVTVAGQPLKAGDPASAISAGVGFCTEDRKKEGLALRLSILLNMTLVKLPFLSKAGVINRRAQKAAADEYMNSISIKAPSVHQLVGNLSGGNQQKVVVAKWLMMGPKVLIVDEPTRGIDVGSKSEIYGLLSDLAKQGMAIVVVSSEIEEILGVCDSVVTIFEGKKTAQLEINSQLTREEVLAAALGGSFSNGAIAGKEAIRDE
ncbi:MAG: sugar ABC transporter ATP-binding protein [Oscillospiraceae bacterium]|nr:sugar ABC transporter ATP-binding protein [Oscillospiraceae bacterium]